MTSRPALAALAAILLAAPSFAQAPAAPQGPHPKSQKEVDALMAIQNATTADARLKAIDDLLTNFADTEFKTQVLDMAVETARQKNDPEAVAAWADRALQANPKDYIAMVDLASVTAGQMKQFDLNLTDEVAKVDKNAHGAIDNVKVATKPNPNMTDDQWKGYQGDITASAYEALGIAASVQKNYPAAIEQFKDGLAASPNAVLRVRLGQAYVLNKQYDEAIAEYDKAMADPNAPAQVKQIAQAAKVSAEKLKAPSAGAAPATPKP